MGTKQIEFSLEIDAPLETVWGVLTDVQQYSTWNPFIVEAASNGDPCLAGTILSFSVRWLDGGSASSKEQVTQVQVPDVGSESPLEAIWSYRFHSVITKLGMIKTLRTQSLSQALQGPTVYTNQFTMAGWGAGLAPFDKIEPGMKAQGQALKRVCETFD